MPNSMSNNQISITNLSKIYDNGFEALKKINLSGNEISSINEIVYKMRKVELLDLSNNNLKDIPKNLSKLNKLKLLNLSGNPLPLKVIDDLRKKMPNTRIQFI